MGLLRRSSLHLVEQLCTCLAAPAHGVLHLTRVLPLLPVREEEDASIARMNEQVIWDARAYLHAVAQRLREGEAARLDLTVTSSVVVHPDRHPHPYGRTRRIRRGHRRVRGSVM